MISLLFFYNIFHLDYFMCVCLFSALSCRVGALQISIIIIILSVGSGERVQVLTQHSKKKHACVSGGGGGGG